MAILSLRFEAELSHKCWLRGNDTIVKVSFENQEQKKPLTYVSWNSFPCHLGATLLCSVLGCGFFFLVLFCLFDCFFVLKAVANS